MKPIHLKIDLNRSWLFDFATDVNRLAGTNIRISDNRFIFPPTIATGFAEVNEIETGLSFCTMELFLKQKLTIEYVKNERSPNCYFRYNTGSYNSEETVDEEHHFTKGSNLHALMIYKAATATGLSGDKGAYLNYMWVIMSEQWMQTNLGETPWLKDVPYIFHSIDMQLYATARQTGEIRSIAYDLRLVAYKGIILQLVSLSLSKIIQQQSDVERIDFADKEKIIYHINKVFADLSRPFPTVDKLAAGIFMSKSKFNALFKKIYQKNVYEYYTELRMQKAMALLRTGKYPVAEVAHRISYQNLGHFSRAFRKYYGMLPKDCIPKLSGIRWERNMQAF